MTNIHTNIVFLLLFLGAVLNARNNLKYTSLALNNLCHYADVRGAALEPMLGQCYVIVDLFGAFLGAMSSPC